MGCWNASKGMYDVLDDSEDPPGAAVAPEIPELPRLCHGAIIQHSWRYLLWREVHREGEGRGVCTFVMLNPSTADGERDDATIRKCVAYARRWGYRWLVVVNMFAYRATDQKDLLAARDAGVDLVIHNDDYVEWACSSSDIVIGAWAHDKVKPGRARELREVVERAAAGRLHYLKLNKDGNPSHPLYLRGDAVPLPFPCTKTT